MSGIALKATVTASVLAGGTFTVPYRDQVQADFTAGQTVVVTVFEREFTCAVAFGASVATVTWPADAPYNLPADVYYIDFDLIGGDLLPPNTAQALNQVASANGGVTASANGGVTASANGGVAASANGGVADSAATDVAGIVADFNAFLTKYNALVTEHDGLGTKHNGLVADHDGLVTKHNGLVTDHDGLVTKYNGLVTEHNAALTKLKDAGLMAPDA